MHSRLFRAWVACLAAVLALGLVMYLRQLERGLAVTGMGREVAWGLYIGQFTFAVGLAASAVMLTLPYYLHGCRAFARLVLLGELAAVSATSVCLLFVLVDLGQPSRALNVLLHPSPESMMFWDMVSLTGYLALNLAVAGATLWAERRGIDPPRWMKPLVLLSIPWAVSIHTVTAFLYCGLPGRPLWLTAILAPRFLASAFAAGPALLILLGMALRNATRMDVPEEAERRLATLAAYAMALNVFFLLVELFTALYSGVPEHREALRWLYLGAERHAMFVPWMWLSSALAGLSLAILVRRRWRERRRALAAACGALFVSLWIEKGAAMTVAGFVPSPTGAAVEYAPTLAELAIAAGVWAAGLLLATAAIRLALGVRGELVRS